MSKQITSFAETALALAALAAPARADEIPMGILLGFTGPIESLTPSMAASAELAWKEASDSGQLLNGSTIKPIHADNKCIDTAVATAAAERLVTSDRVAGIMGADCSGVTTAVVNNVSATRGVVTISPSATSPGLSTVEDRGFFFRTAPSDARQGQVLADVAWRRGVREIAITYTNNDYGKGLSDSFGSAFKRLGGKVVASNPHEDGRADYSAEVAALAATGTP